MNIELKKRKYKYIVIFLREAKITGLVSRSCAFYLDGIKGAL